MEKVLNLLAQEIKEKLKQNCRLLILPKVEECKTATLLYKVEEASGSHIYFFGMILS